MNDMRKIMNLVETKRDKKYYKGEQVRVVKAVKGETGEIIQYKIEDMNKTWTDYVKPDQLENKKLKEAVYGFREQAFILGYQDGHADAKSGYNDAEAALNLWRKNRKI